MTLEEAMSQPDRPAHVEAVKKHGREACVSKWRVWELSICWCGEDGKHAAQESPEMLCDACALKAERAQHERNRAIIARLLVGILTAEQQERFMSFDAAADMALANVERLRRAASAAADPREQGRGIRAQPEPSTCDVGADWED